MKTTILTIIAALTIMSCSTETTGTTYKISHETVSSKLKDPFYDSRMHDNFETTSYHVEVDLRVGGEINIIKNATLNGVSGKAFHHKLKIIRMDAERGHYVVLKYDWDLLKYYEGGREDTVTITEDRIIFNIGVFKYQYYIM